jgi:type II secretory pathway pseudopilin PulG
MTTPTISRRRHAFSLVEALASVAIIGIITFLFLPNIVTLRSTGERNLAIARAEAFNMAVSGYIMATGQAQASTNWAAANTEATRYALVRPFLAYSPDAVTNFMPSGYTIAITNLAIPSTSATAIAKIGLSGPNPTSGTTESIAY